MSPLDCWKNGGEGEADYYGESGTNRIAGERGYVIDDYSPKGKVKGCFGFRGISGTVIKRKTEIVIHIYQNIKR